MHPTPSSLKAFLPISTAMFTAMLGFGMMVPALPQLVADVSSGATAAGILLSGFGLARLAINMPAGMVSDRIGIKATMIWGLVILAAGSLIAAVPAGYFGLMAGLALQGAGSAVFATAGLSALADAGGPERRGTAMAWFQSAFLLSISTGPVVGGWVVGLLGVRAPFLVHAGLSLATLGGILLLPEPARPVRRASSGGMAFHLLSRPLVAGACAMGLAGFFARSAVGWALVPTTAAHEFGLPPSGIGLLVGVGTFTSLVTMPLVGRSIDRIGAVPVLIASGLASIVALAGFVIVPHEWVLWLATAIIMVGTSAQMSAAGALILAESADVATGAVMGLFRTAGDVGVAAGPAAAPGLAALVGLGAVHGYSVTAVVMTAAVALLAAAMASTRGVTRAA